MQSFPTLGITLKDDCLFRESALVFKPGGDFELCIYEVVSNRYILVSAVPPSQKNSSYIYLLARRKVKILTLENWEVSEYDLGGKQLIGINNGFLELQRGDGPTEYLKL